MVTIVRDPKIFTKVVTKIALSKILTKIFTKIHVTKTQTKIVTIIPTTIPYPIFSPKIVIYILKPKILLKTVTIIHEPIL